VLAYKVPMEVWLAVQVEKKNVKLKIRFGSNCHSGGVGPKALLQVSTLRTAVGYQQADSVGFVHVVLKVKVQVYPAEERFAFIVGTPTSQLMVEVVLTSVRAFERSRGM
jgi:hypothetical protein